MKYTAPSGYDFEIPDEWLDEARVRGVRVRQKAYSVSKAPAGIRGKALHRLCSSLCSSSPDLRVVTPTGCALRLIASSTDMEFAILCSDHFPFQISQVSSQLLLASVPLCDVAYERHHPLNRAVDALQKLDRELNGDLPAVLMKRRHC